MVQETVASNTYLYLACGSKSESAGIVHFVKFSKTNLKQEFINIWAAYSSYPGIHAILGL